MAFDVQDKAEGNKLSTGISLRCHGYLQQLVGNDDRARDMMTEQMLPRSVGQWQRHLTH